MPVEEYFAIQQEKNEQSADSNIDEKESDKKLPGERTPFFEERLRRKEIDEEIDALKKDRAQISKDVQYAEYVGSSDLPFSFWKLASRFDSFLRSVAIGIFLTLLVLTPVMFAGIVSANSLPKYSNINFQSKPGMVIGVEGSVFSTVDLEGNFSYFWSDELDNEIELAKELKATHLKYNIKSRALNNNASKSNLIEGLSRVKSNGLELIVCIKGDFSYTKREMIENVYTSATFIANEFKPEYMIIYNEVNGELINSINEYTTFNEWLPEITNLTDKIKTISPTTNVGSTFLATKEGLVYFDELLNSTIGLDFVGISYFPVFFGWRFSILEEYSVIFHDINTVNDFWISDTGMESFNYGEDAQAKYIAKVLDYASDTSKLNASGVCIKSLIDNSGYTAERGITSHFGLVYYNGRKKKSFDAFGYAANIILGI